MGKSSSRKSKRADKVVFPRYAGSEVKVGGEDMLLMTEDEIVGVDRGFGRQRNKPKKEE